MKKTLILASILALAASTQCFAADNASTTSNVIPKKEASVEKQVPSEIQTPPKGPDADSKCDTKKTDFEKRLKLTDEQKAKAKAIREKGHHEMQPVMDKIEQKHAAIRKIRESELPREEQAAQIDKLRGEIRALNRYAHDLRMRNMKEFESILTKKQTKELNKMKNEGRKKFDKEFKKKHGDAFRPPFPPDFGHKAPMDFRSEPDFPPPPPMDEK